MHRTHPSLLLKPRVNVDVGIGSTRMIKWCHKCIKNDFQESNTSHVCSMLEYIGFLYMDDHLVIHILPNGHPQTPVTVTTSST